MAIIRSLLLVLPLYAFAGCSSKENKLTDEEQMALRAEQQKKVNSAEKAERAKPRDK